VRKVNLEDLAGSFGDDEEPLDAAPAPETRVAPPPEPPAAEVGRREPRPLILHPEPRRLPAPGRREQDASPVMHLIASHDSRVLRPDEWVNYSLRLPRYCREEGAARIPGDRALLGAARLAWTQYVDAAVQMLPRDPADPAVISPARAAELGREWMAEHIRDPASSLADGSGTRVRLETRRLLEALRPALVGSRVSLYWVTAAAVERFLRDLPADLERRSAGERGPG
jgi:hypothetical protein